jgi:hypothetical protein
MVEPAPIVTAQLGDPGGRCDFLLVIAVNQHSFSGGERRPVACGAEVEQGPA